MRFLKRLSQICLVLGTAGGGALFSQGQIAIDAYPVEGIEYKPLPAIFVVAARGAVREASLELTNTRSEALEIVGISNTSERFKARVDILEEGRRFRIVVTLKGEGPAGRKQEILQLKTNLADAPVLRIPVNYRVRETVYSFPQSVFMGRYPLSEVAGNQELSRSRAQTLMVYRKETTGFEIKASSDIPFLRIESEQGPDGDRWENTIYYDVEKASAGEVRGTIFIETNDPTMPKLEIPIWGDLQDR